MRHPDYMLESIKREMKYERRQEKERLDKKRRRAKSKIAKASRKKNR